MEQPTFLILAPTIRPTTTCTNRANCNQTIEFFRDICLGTLDLDERKSIADKVVVKLEEFGTQIEKEDWDILNHYINNLLLAYTTMAIEYKRRTGKEFHSPSAEFSTCDVHRIVFGILQLLETGTPEQKHIFLTHLKGRFQEECISSSRNLLEALRLTQP